LKVTEPVASPSLAVTVMVWFLAPFGVAAASRAAFVGVKVYVLPLNVTVPVDGWVTLKVSGSLSGSVKFRAPETAPVVVSGVPTAGVPGVGARLVPLMGTVKVTGVEACPSLATTVMLAVLAPCAVFAASRAAWLGVKV
jgi:hypothetical protein